MKKFFFIFILFTFLAFLGVIFLSWKNFVPRQTIFEASQYLPFSEFEILSQNNFKILSQKTEPFSFKIPKNFIVKKETPSPEQFIFLFFYQNPEINEFGIPNKCLIKFWVEKNQLFYQYLLQLREMENQLKPGEILLRPKIFGSQKGVESVFKKENFGEIIQVQIPFQEKIYNFEAFLPSKDTKCQEAFWFMLNTLSFGD